MKVTLKHIAQGALAVTLMGGPALAENLCASSEQRQIVQDFLAENPSMMPGRGPSPSNEQIAKFDEIMAMIKDRPSACPG